MRKRTFLKLSSAIIGGAVISPMISWQQDDKIKNWAGNLTYGTTKINYPTSVEEVQELVKKYNKLKVLGSKHCFNTIADTKDVFISSKKLDQFISLDKDAKKVTVGAGITYGKLSPYLQENGFALHNLASLPHISVAGACITATHGSGEKNGNLATAVSGLEIVNAAGDVIHLSREKDGERFNAAVVNLGALGVVTKITLDLLPAFNVKQNVYTKLPMEQLKNHFDEIEGSGYSVSLFTDWKSDFINEVWIKSLAENDAPAQTQPEFYGAVAATKNLHPIIDLSAENCTEQMGVPGPWYERLPHFKMGFTPSSGVELQTEYFVPRKHAVDAISAVAKLGDQVSPHLFITEIRTINADNFWMSPCYQQESVAIHFTWKQDWPNVSKLLPVIEKELAPFNAKPHWGKLFSISPARLKELYVKLPEFKQLVQEFDPQGKFRNEFLNKNIYGA